MAPRACRETGERGGGHYLPQQQHGTRLQLAPPRLQQRPVHGPLHCPCDIGGHQPWPGELLRIPGSPPVEASPVGSLSTTLASTLLRIRDWTITAMAGTLFPGSCLRAACGDTRDTVVTVGLEQGLHEGYGPH